MRTLLSTSFFGNAFDRSSTAAHRRIRDVAGNRARRANAARAVGWAAHETLECRRLLSGYTLSALANLDASTESPFGGVIMDAAGNLYGTAELGGVNNDGGVFELSKSNGVVTSLAAIPAISDGTRPLPLSSLLMDAGGNLYGTTEQGGANRDGTVFELAAGSGVISTLGVFDGTNGSHPMAGLVADDAGDLYGTSSGGSSGLGTVFEVAAGSGVITTLASTGASNANFSQSSLIIDGAGNLYGVTALGGANGVGSVYEVPHGSNALTVLASFNTINGSAPIGALVMDGAGNLYGTCTGGDASSDGNVFEVVKGSGVITTLATFNGINGAFPSTPLLLDAAGDLLGTAGGGGPTNDGTVFEVTKGSGDISVLATFNGIDGNGPTGAISMDAAGNIYGAAEMGGANGDGTIFEVSPDTTVLPPPTVIANPSFEDNSAWVPSVTGGELSGTYDNTWASQGSNSYQFVRPAGGTTPGDSAQISQTGVDLTGIAGLEFDCQDTGIDGEPLQFLVDGTVVGQFTNDGWPLGMTIDHANSANWGHTAISDNIQIPFSAAFTGLHALTIQMSEGGSYDPLDPKIFKIDNIRAFTSQSAMLAFTQQPSDTGAGASIGQVQVSVENAFGAVMATDNSPVTLATSTGAALNGTATVAAVNGVATFSDLSITTPGAYTLTATDGALTTTTSSSFTVFPPPSIGNLDPTFGVDGLVAHAVNLTSTAGLVVQSDGKSVIAGTSGSAGSESFGITRYNADGSLDTTFGTDGFTSTSFGADAEATAEALLPNGDILVGGTLFNGEGAGSQFALAEYTPAGVLDTTFGDGAGYVLASFSANSGGFSNDMGRALAVGPDGTIYLGGSSDAAGNGLDFAIAAFTSVGNPSSSFGANGQTLLDFMGGDDSIGALAFGSKGVLIAAGSAIDPASGVSSVAVAEFLPSGALDTKFGNGGKLTTSAGHVADAASAVALDAKGNIVVGGASATGSASDGTLSSNFLLLRYASTGKLDKTFGNGGIVTTSFNQPAAITNLLIDPDGTIVASGKTAASLATLDVSQLNLAAARYTVKGQLDTSFNNTGQAIYDLATGVTTTSLTTHSGVKEQPALLQSVTSIPFDTTADLMTKYNQLLNSDQGVGAMTTGGELTVAGNQQNLTYIGVVLLTGFDLAATLTASLPQSIIGGGKGAASVTIAELGTESAEGSFTIELFASSGSYVTPDQMPFQSVPEKLKLKQGMAKSIKLKFSFPDSLSKGDYYLVALIATGTTHDFNPANNMSSSASPVLIAPPFVQLSGGAFTAPTFDGAKPASISITITNAGNETASATSAVQFFASTTGTPTGAISLATTPLKLNLKSEAVHVYKLKLALPATLPAGMYMLVALLDPANVFSDPNAAMNFIVSGNIFMVA